MKNKKYIKIASNPKEIMRSIVVEEILKVLNENCVISIAKPEQFILKK